MTPAAIQLTRQLARAESELAGWERRAVSTVSEAR